MEPQFKFGIGDFVVPRVSWENCKLYAGVRLQTNDNFIVQPQIMVVNQRRLEECPGGVQYHYECRAWLPGQESRLISFNEIELRAWNLEECVALFPKKF